jgi:hypothetical protein
MRLDHIRFDATRFVVDAALYPAWGEARAWRRGCASNLVKAAHRASFDAQDPSLYSPVWVRTIDPDKHEHVGSVVSVTHTGGVQGGGGSEASKAGKTGGDTAQLVMRAPEMPATGPAAFFVRAGAVQKSAELSCAPATHAGACVHFSRRSPSISCSIVLLSGGAGWGLVEASEDGAGRPAYNQ